MEGGDVGVALAKIALLVCLAEEELLEESQRVAVPADQIEIARLKKRKLMLKDEIAQLADRIVPDLLA